MRHSPIATTAFWASLSYQQIAIKTSSIARDSPNSHDDGFEDHARGAKRFGPLFDKDAIGIGNGSKETDNQHLDAAKQHEKST